MKETQEKSRINSKLQKTNRIAKMKKEQLQEDLELMSCICYSHKQNLGITLIALVVTIVILLILSGVTINMLLGEDGIIRTAQEAKNTWEGAVANEQEEIQNLANELNEIITGGGELPTVPEEWDLTKVTPVLSDDNQYVPVPNGFVASTVTGEKNVNDGFVIKQENDGSLTTEKNEFVWIPVDETSLAEMYTEAMGTPLSSYEGLDITTDVYSKPRIKFGSFTAGIPGSNNVREPDFLNDTNWGDASTNSSRGIALIKSTFGYDGTNAQIIEQFANMLVTDYETNYASIKKYGGFYIGRYELTGTIESPTVQKGKNVIVNQNWYNSYKVCNNMINTASAKSTMIYGNQWDEVLDWLVNTGMDSSEVYIDSSKWGNYINYNEANGYTEGDPGYEATAGVGVQLAGSSENWKANNIYDLAGNAREWTQEAYRYGGRIDRGGWSSYLGSEGPAALRSNDGPEGIFSNVSARIVLYVKI